MTLTLITPPAEEPVSLADLKAHLRVSDTAEDALIAGLGLAARQAIEARCGLAFIAQGWRLEIAAASCIALPVGPLTAITRVARLSSNGDETIIDPSAYDVLTGRNGRLVLNSGVATAGRLLIDFTAGWPDAAAVPADLGLALRMLTAHFHEHREAAGPERLFSAPEALAALLAPWRRTSL